MTEWRTRDNSRKSVQTITGRLTTGVRNTRAVPTPFPPLSTLHALFRLLSLLFFRSVFPPLIRLTDANTRCICNTSLSSHDPRKVSGNKALEAENTLQRYFLHASRKLIFATCRSSITWQAFSNNSKVTWIGFRSPRFTICCLV